MKSPELLFNDQELIHWIQKECWEEISGDLSIKGQFRVEDAKGKTLESYQHVLLFYQDEPFGFADIVEKEGKILVARCGRDISLELMTRDEILQGLKFLDHSERRSAKVKLAFLEVCTKIGWQVRVEARTYFVTHGWFVEL